MNCIPSHSGPGAGASRTPSAHRPHRVQSGLRTERGVALVVTLILLVVITTLAVAFLALTHRETAAVTGFGAGTDSDLGAEAGSQRAMSQIKASFFTANPTPPMPPANPYAPYRPNNIIGPDLMVSVASTNGTNRLNVSGMWTNPTPPVFIQTNRGATVLEDRWYLDLNRNNRFEPSGYLVDVDEAGNVVRDGNGNPVVQWRIGDPQWIGILRDPTKPHGEFNPFIARYAFILLPAGRTLDLNWIHNDTKDVRLGPGYTGFFRNQGVGSFEMNLAGFLADLNPAYWSPPGADGYNYAFTNNPVFANTGAAFRDSLQILTNRYYRGDKRTLATPAMLFAMTGPLGANYFPVDYVNAFADGPLALFGRSQETALLADQDDSNRPWPGADGQRHYFALHDLLDPNRMPDAPPDGGFRQRLTNASARVNSEDRYTYYRLLAQAGTDSVPERDDRIDVNYISVGGLSPTNMIPWTSSNAAVITALKGDKPSELFFHSAADRLLTNEFYRYGITNVRLSRLPGQGIPVYTNGSVFIAGNSNNPPIYNARIHQLLQMTLNIYEATRTNEPNPALWPNPPTVMRPLFERRANGDIYITGYRDETGRDLRADLTTPWYELSNPPRQTSLQPDIKFYDIPILFGTRKGIPNFNEFTMNTLVHFSRKVQVEKNASGANIATNQMFIMSVSNFFICEMLNSYSNFPNANFAYPRELELRVGVVSTSVITNRTGTALVSQQSTGYAAAYPALSWTGGQYRLTLTMTNLTLPTSIYYERPPLGPGFRLFDNAAAINNQFETVLPGSSNRWGMAVSNRFLCMLFERSSGRLLDCFSSARMNSRLDVWGELDNYRRAGSPFDQMWDPARGVESQVRLSSGQSGDPRRMAAPAGLTWADFFELRGFSTVEAGMAGFKAFLDATSTPPTNRFHQAPFSPNVIMLQANSWEANDPIVHYTVYDLYDTGSRSNGLTVRMTSSDPYVSIFTNAATKSLVSSPGRVNKRYSPWGGYQGAGLPEDLAYADKDPGLFYPDLWDFPTQKFPNAGWLGRVHRGTPWQTIYLKAADPSYSLAAWRAHTGAAYLPDTFPTNDWRLLDLFTVAIHPNATRGRLSINQTNAAAWSAVLAGVPVTAVDGDDASGYLVYQTNIMPSAVLAETAIQPGPPRVSVLNPIHTVVEGIQRVRNQLPGRQFTKLSEFMQVPTLTVESPYISNFVFNANSEIRKLDGLLTDSDYERIPQQILSLVKVGEPRYVIYAWGQSLKPAEYGVRLNGSVVEKSGVGIDQATKTPINYQITGETATRSVVRVEFEKDSFGRTRYDRPHAVVETFNILPND